MQLHNARRVLWDGQALDRDDVGPGDQPTEQVRREPAHGGLVLTGRVGGKLRWILPQRGGLQRDLRNRLWLRLRLWLSRVEPNTIPAIVMIIFLLYQT